MPDSTTNSANPPAPLSAEQKAAVEILRANAGTITILTGDLPSNVANDNNVAEKRIQVDDGPHAAEVKAALKTLGVSDAEFAPAESWKSPAEVANNAANHRAIAQVAQVMADHNVAFNGHQNFSAQRIAAVGGVDLPSVETPSERSAATRDITPTQEVPMPTAAAALASAPQPLTPEQRAYETLRAHAQNISVQDGYTKDYGQRLVFDLKSPEDAIAVKAALQTLDPNIKNGGSVQLEEMGSRLEVHFNSRKGGDREFVTKFASRLADNGVPFQNHEAHLSVIEDSGPPLGEEPIARTAEMLNPAALAPDSATASKTNLIKLLQENPDANVWQWNFSEGTIPAGEERARQFQILSDQLASKGFNDLEYLGRGSFALVVAPKDNADFVLRITNGEMGTRSETPYMLQTAGEYHAQTGLNPKRNNKPVVFKIEALKRLDMDVAHADKSEFFKEAELHGNPSAGNPRNREIGWYTYTKDDGSVNRVVIATDPSAFRDYAGTTHEPNYPSLADQAVDNLRIAKADPRLAEFVPALEKSVEHASSAASAGEPAPSRIIEIPIPENAADIRPPLLSSPAFASTPEPTITQGEPTFAAQMRQLEATLDRLDQLTGQRSVQQGPRAATAPEPIAPKIETAFAAQIERLDGIIEQRLGPEAATRFREQVPATPMQAKRMLSGYGSAAEQVNATESFGRLLDEVSAGRDTAYLNTLVNNERPANMLGLHIDVGHKMSLERLGGGSSREQELVNHWGTDGHERRFTNGISAADILAAKPPAAAPAPPPPVVEPPKPAVSAAAAEPPSAPAYVRDQVQVRMMMTHDPSVLLKSTAVAADTIQRFGQGATLGTDGEYGQIKIAHTDLAHAKNIAAAMQTLAPDARRGNIVITDTTVAFTGSPQETQRLAAALSTNGVALKPAPAPAQPAPPVMAPEILEQGLPRAQASRVPAQFTPPAVHDRNLSYTTPDGKPGPNVATPAPTPPASGASTPTPTSGSTPAQVNSAPPPAPANSTPPPANPAGTTGPLTSGTIAEGHGGIFQNPLVAEGALLAGTGAGTHLTASEAHIPPPTAHITSEPHVTGTNGHGFAHHGAGTALAWVMGGNQLYNGVQQLRAGHTFEGLAALTGATFDIGTATLGTLSQSGIISEASKLGKVGAAAGKVAFVTSFIETGTEAWHAMHGESSWGKVGVTAGANAVEFGAATLATSGASAATGTAIAGAAPVVAAAAAGFGAQQAGRELYIAGREIAEGFGVKIDHKNDIAHSMIGQIAVDTQDLSASAEGGLTIDRMSNMINFFHHDAKSDLSADAKHKSEQRRAFEAAHPELRHHDQHPTIAPDMLKQIEAAKHAHDQQQHGHETPHASAPTQTAAATKTRGTQLG